jgi:putative addiction module killer protein
LKQIEKFRTADGKTPFDEWINKLDVSVRAAIRAYIDRVALGGARRNVTRIKEGDGVFEITIDKGPGYRVYFGEFNNRVILLLAGGIKKGQFRDIEMAKKYWRAQHAQTSHL